MNDYYYILGLKKDANQQEIKIAYRKLSKKFHPDVNPDDSFFEERFKEIQQAYETLSNPIKKATYDRLTGNYTNQKTKTEGTADKNSESSNDANLRKEQEKKEQREREKRQEEENRRHKQYEKKIKREGNQKTFGCIFGIIILIAAIAIFIDESGKSKVNNPTKSHVLSTFLIDAFYIGNISQLDIRETWNIELEIDKSKNIYKVKYPSLKCGGVWHLINESKDKISFREKILFGKEICTDSGKIIIEKVNDELVLSYYFPDDETLNAQGKIMQQPTFNIVSKPNQKSQSANSNKTEDNTNQNSSNELQNSEKYKGNQLSNGKSPLDDCFGKGIYNGEAYLIFDNSNQTDAIVCLVSISNGKTIRNVYIKAGAEFKMTQIPSGKYFIKVYYGNDWNPEKENFCQTNGAFQRNVHYSKSDNTSDIIEIENSTYSYTTGRITLYAVQNGNMSSENINENTFFNE